LAFDRPVSSSKTHRCDRFLWCQTIAFVTVTQH
jgi:hypothetical protein